MPLFILAMGLAGLVRAAGNKRSVTATARFERAFLASAMFAGLLLTASCAGYIHQNTVQPTSYVVTVTASAANGPTHTQQFTLTITP